ncbi:XRE family transcriptional regulator [Flavobacterium granuli]|uniref:Transcriptional regulator with XRE-family HTH domain n=1 Tax=Flavobacterium granuli TaxID=280093 RepID=A0ABU1S3V4_9FLAO|nr:XRE family transcriptional regulator [Flavobacterium granuli]MDR6845732.1 transcriptional regulator with XRE-family HTH domain [Flavobacterium granuli]
MLYISDNLKWLRSKRNLSQQEVADGMTLPLDRYKKYEYGKNTPPAETLVIISRYYHISIDLILTVDLRKISIDNLMQLDDNRIVLPITVDQDGNNLIEIIPHKAQAGYLSGYADAEYIENLQQIALPFLGPGKMRAFPINGDSMPPHTNQSIVVGKYVDNLGEIKKNKTYILITSSEGITYKRLGDKKDDSLTVVSDNIIYNPYEIKLSDILEIWEYVCHIGRDDAKHLTSESDTVKEMFLELKRDINEIKQKK